MNKTRIFRQVFWVICGLMFCLSLQKPAIHAETNEVNARVDTREEIPAMRNEYCKGYQNSDGSVSIVISSMPLHFQDETGKWGEINTTLEDSNQEADENGQKYGFRNISNTLESYLPQNSNGWVQLRSGKSRLSFRLVTNNNKAFQKEGSDTITGHDILPKCDVSLAVKNAALKEDLILKDRTAPKQFEYQFILHNLDAEKTPDGAIQFKDKQGNPVFIMPKMVMYDSNQATSEDIETMLTGQGEKYRLTVNPNLQWLTDPERKYPITVDPTTIRITGSGSDPSKGVGTLVYYLPGIDFITADTSEITYSKSLSSGTFYMNNYSDVRADYFPFNVSYTVTATSQGTSSPYWSSSSGAIFKIDAWDPNATSNAANTLGNIFSYGFSNKGGSITKTFPLLKGQAVRFKINNVNFYRALGTNPWSCNVSMTITCQRESMSPEPPVITQLAPETYERSATLSWTAPIDTVNIDPATGQPYPNFDSAKIKEYVLQRSTSSDFTQNITEVHVAAPDTSYTFTDLSDNATYFFRCYAVDGDGNPTDLDHPWDPVNCPSGVRWSVITKTTCIPATLKPLSQSVPALTRITPGNARGSGLYSNNRNPNISFTTNIPAQPFVNVAAGWYHSLALNADGTVYCWGLNTYGKLGDGAMIVQKYPIRVSATLGQPLSNITAIACGKSHSLALKSDGTVWAWGANGSGQLGNGTTTQPIFPVQVMLNATTPLTGVIAVSCGSLSSYALKNDGTVWSWGENGSGQLGYGNTTDQLYAVQMKVGSTPITNVIAIAAGVSHILALKNDGTVWASGLNSLGQLGNNSLSTSTTFVQVKDSAGTGYLTGITAIAAANHSLALANDGTIWAWGNNAYGQLGNGNTTKQQKPVHLTAIDNVTAVDAGTTHSLALKNDGTLWAWGDNNNGQLGYSGNYTQMNTPVQVKIQDPADVGNMDNVCAFDGGNTHTMAARNDGSVWLWGDDTNGILGDGQTVKQYFPFNTIRGLQTQGQLRATRYQESPGAALDYSAIPFNPGSGSAGTNWNLPDGKYLLWVGIPATGGGFAWSVANRLTIDTVLPNPFTVTVNPSGWTSNQQPVLTFNTTDDGSGIDHYELTIDNGAAQTITSPYTLPTQKNGIHSLKVTAFDQAGNGREATATIYIDTTPPDSLEVSAKTSGWTSNRQPEINFKAKDTYSGIDHYELAIDGAGAQTVTSPYILPVQAEGTHTIKITAVDKVGLRQEETTTVSIDFTNPQASITSPASNATVSGSVLIQAEGTDAVSGVDRVEFYIDNIRKITVNQSPYQYSFSASSYMEGRHTIQVKVFDRAGNSREPSVDINTESDAVSISGVLDTNQVWGGEYILTGNVTVPAGKTLTILAGTTITSVTNQPDNGALIIEGFLDVQGVTGKPVLFQTSGTIWPGIQIKSTGIATITYATISGAKRGLAITGGRATVTNCLFSNNQTGLHVYGASSIVTVTDTIFNGNTYYGIKEDAGALPQIINCGFATNGADYYSSIDTEVTWSELNDINNNSGNHSL